VGQPGTEVRLGGVGTDNAHSGVRAFFGIGVDRDSCGSVDGNFFFLEQHSHPRFSSNGGPDTVVLTRPFFNIVAAAEDADPTAFPSVASGTIQVSAFTRLTGGDLNMRYHYLIENDGSRLVFLVGGRYLRLDEGLNMSVTSADIPGFGDPGIHFFTTEGIGTTNKFYGAQIGAEYECRVGPIFIQAAGKAALGRIQQTVQSSAFTSITDSRGVTTTSQNVGLYISPSNAGTFTRSRSAFLPEGKLRMGIDFNEYVSLSIGYTFLFLDTAVRPASQLDRNVTVQPIGFAGTFSPTPGFSFQSTTFWAQGLDVGLCFSF
jgi:hypothetical protein